MDVINLWPENHMDAGTVNEGCPSITLYLRSGEGPHPLMVVCPGGGYTGRAPHEGEPIARWLNSLGISAVVLNYRVAPYRHPTPLEDASRAVRLVRHQATAWNVDPNRVGILGFSAGGHLASTVGTHYDLGNPNTDGEIEKHSSRPDLMVLCYPVITMGTYTHEGSRNTLLGENNTEATAEHLSNEKQVTADTPPTFLWHTADDDAVPVENSLLFASALSRHHVPFALYTFERGSHGLGLAEDDPDVTAWTQLCESWLKVRGFISK